jgi:transcriptional regulator with XRE-family HTH domain
MDERPRLAKRIGLALREQRRLHGWSQERLAECADLSPHFVGLVERGKQLPSLTTLVVLSKVLGVQTDDLLAQRGSPSLARWELEALAILKSVPAPFRPGILAMLRAISNPARARRRRRS